MGTVLVSYALLVPAAAAVVLPARDAAGRRVRRRDPALAGRAPDPAGDRGPAARRAAAAADGGRARRGGGRRALGGAPARRPVPGRRRAGAGQRRPGRTPRWPCWAARCCRARPRWRSRRGRRWSAAGWSPAPAAAVGVLRACGLPAEWTRPASRPGCPPALRAAAVAVTGLRHRRAAALLVLALALGVPDIGRGLPGRSPRTSARPSGSDRARARLPAQRRARRRPAGRSGRASRSAPRPRRRSPPTPGEPLDLPAARRVPGGPGPGVGGRGARCCRCWSGC